MASWACYEASGRQGDVPAVQHYIYHCFCDHLALVQSSCSDTTPRTLMGFCTAMVVSFLPLLLVLLSYMGILASVLRINSKEGRSKAFSTCSSHLLVVGTYYSSIAVAYVAYRADLSLDLHIVGNVVFAILTPVLNPLIYTLRNKDVKAAITKIMYIKTQAVTGILTFKSS
ncbi:olfactory receptor 2AT4-like [Mus pahari]|uniref:olfactory receptor 2AT4-like n=1 Tax=Mus pahari TaxID=10093 RepID=UPI000A3080A2|nr:olfactory receptor 2AT4-like [Mus pahari]